MTRTMLSCLLCITWLSGCFLADGASTSSSSGGDAGSMAEQDGAGGSGGESEPASCDDESVCGSAQGGCVRCAVSGPCAAAVAACQASLECADFEICASNCQGNQPCIEICMTTYAQGASLYRAMSACIYCDECFVSCGGANLGC